MNKAKENVQTGTGDAGIPASPGNTLAPTQPGNEEVPAAIVPVMADAPPPAWIARFFGGEDPVPTPTGAPSPPGVKVPIKVDTSLNPELTNLLAAIKRRYPEEIITEETLQDIQRLRKLSGPLAESRLTLSILDIYWSMLDDDMNLLPRWLRKISLGKLFKRKVWLTFARKLQSIVVENDTNLIDQSYNMGEGRKKLEEEYSEFLYLLENPNERPGTKMSVGIGDVPSVEVPVRKSLTGCYAGSGLTNREIFLRCLAITQTTEREVRWDLWLLFGHYHGWQGRMMDQTRANTRKYIRTFNPLLFCWIDEIVGFTKICEFDAAWLEWVRRRAGIKWLRNTWRVNQARKMRESGQAFLATLNE